MAGLVAINLPGGPDFIDTLQRVWANGDAALPLDPRLPDRWVAHLIDHLAPTSIIESDLIERPLDTRRADPPLEPGDTLVIATSGTTGTPKGVVLTHAAVEAAAFASMTYLGVTADCTWLACLPLHHIGGISVITRAIVCGTGLIAHPEFDGAAVERAARQHGATHVSLVPTTLGRIDPSVFERILLGGSAIPADRPANSVATYGMTESGAGVVYDGLPLNGVGLRIDADGMIALSGPTMMRCYRDGSDPRGPDGWYRTGDMGRVDPGTGLLTVLGRGDDMIITGGENVWPDSVERILLEDPSVSEVAVIGRPHPEWGQRVTAVIVPVDANRPPDLARLRELVKRDLPAWCAPHAIELAESLPRTAIGKVRRRAL